MKKIARENLYVTLFVVLLTFSLMMVACTTTNEVVNNSENTVVEDVVEPPPPTDEPAPPPDQSAQLAAWEEGIHNIYDLGHGPNTWCARCHSPQNWDPEAIVGPPPDCITCKFDHEEELRVAPGNDLVTEEEWVGIACDTCHEVDENGTVAEGYGWLNPISMEFQSVANTTDLCEMCHVTTTGNSFGSGVDHLRTLGGSAHLNYGGFMGDVAPPQYCGDCHDPHSGEAVACESCHAVLDDSEHMMGLNALHTNVTCMACHDAEGYDSGPAVTEELNGVWVTQETTVGRGGPSTNDVVSHSIVYTVACDRCHFEENTNGLPVLTADGEIPEPPAEEEGGAP